MLYDYTDVGFLLFKKIKSNTCFTYFYIVKFSKRQSVFQLPHGFSHWVRAIIMV